jgi:hypothetical protein
MVDAMGAALVVVTEEMMATFPTAVVRKLVNEVLDVVDVEMVQTEEKMAAAWVAKREVEQWRAEAMEAVARAVAVTAVMTALAPSAALLVAVGRRHSSRRSCIHAGSTGRNRARYGHRGTCRRYTR